MNILFISYWSFHDGLTQGSVIPNLKILRAMPKVNKLVLCTVERGQMVDKIESEDFLHVPLSANTKSGLFAKMDDYIRFPREVAALVKVHKIDLVICRSSLAGAIGLMATLFLKVPFVVESFEPHASYMIESGVWRRYGVRAFVENLFHYFIRKKALYLLPVAEGYARQLRDRYHLQNIRVAPCIVDLEKFNPSKRDRTFLRISENAVVGIYVGKFGGMYYQEEAFVLFCHARSVFDHFHLVILTPDRQYAVQMLKRYNFKDGDFHVLTVPHEQVPGFLASADLAFATYKHSPSKRFLSPIKVGEYWASGLPVILTDGVGDDAAIINTSGFGATFQASDESMLQALHKVKKQLAGSDAVRNNRQLAEQHRKPEILVKVYNEIIHSLS